MKYALILTLFCVLGCSSNDQSLEKLDDISKLNDLDHLTDQELASLRDDVIKRLLLLEVILAPSQRATDSLNISDEPSLTQDVVANLDLLIEYNDLLLTQQLSHIDLQDENCRAFIESQTELSKDLRKTITKRAKGEYRQSNKRARIEKTGHILGEYGSFIANKLEAGTLLSNRAYSCNIEDREEWFSLTLNVSNSLDFYVSAMYDMPGIFDPNFLESLDDGVRIKKRNDTIKTVGVVAADIGVSIVFWQYGVVKLATSLATRGVLHASKLRNATTIVAKSILENKKHKFLAQGITLGIVGTGMYHLEDAVFPNSLTYEPAQVQTYWNDLIARTEYFLELNLNSPVEYVHYFNMLNEQYFNKRKELIAENEDKLDQMKATWGSLENALDGFKEILELLDQQKEEVS